ncbi:PAS fold-containing protein [Pseudidiomarina planktonica]|uniref:PAS fold-containing protein n=1 Tax=Pseudidiomarina planktonica TaxID=1323738 RepID=A0A1Y6EFC6_9GAMM|nr:PAS domain-containing protein [Pseudidiomarina planktonica]SMQ61297.1 PAS fold-containing protein [Pseudidiomarina planktonica]
MSMDDMADMEELHWKLSILGAIDVGIVVVNKNYQIQIWNEFMENHSGLLPSSVREQSLFKVCPEIDADWLQRKARVAWELGSRSFITWQQRPYVFRFGNYRPVTGRSEWMYQNITLLPLASPRGDIEHLCLIVYDVTEQAISSTERAN